MKGKIGRTIWDAIFGSMIGVVSFVALAIAQMISLGIQTGILLGVDGTPVRVVSPSPNLLVAGAVFVGVVCSVMLLRIALSQTAALSISLILIVLVAIGAARFTSDYVTAAGMLGWWDNVLVNGSQTLAIPVLAALCLGLALSRDQGVGRTGKKVPAPTARQQSDATQPSRDSSAQFENR